MKIITAMLVIILLQGCAHSDPWSKQDTVLQSVYTATLLMDAMQTSQIQHRPDLIEVGPVANHFLGDNPSSRDTVMYFGTLAVSNWMISRALPKEWRPYWQGANIAMHGSAVFNNCDLGLGKFCGGD